MRRSLSLFLWFLRALLNFPLFLLFRLTFLYFLWTLLVFCRILLVYFSICGLWLLFLGNRVLRFPSFLQVLGWTWFRLAVFLWLLFWVFVIFSIYLNIIFLIFKIFAGILCLLFRRLFGILWIHFGIFGIWRLLFWSFFIILFLILNEGRNTFFRLLDFAGLLFFGWFRFLWRHGISDYWFGLWKERNICP